MTVIIACEHCKQEFKGRGEYEAELAFDLHECEEIKRCKDMSMEELIEELKKQGKIK